MGRLRGVRILLAVGAAVALLAACQPELPPGVTPRASAAAGGSSGPAPSRAVAGKPTVSLNGTTVRIDGLGTGRSPEFQLPAGSAAMTVSQCVSNGVIPFVTLYDSDDNKLGLIVEATYRLRNLAGGAYSLDVAANPDCAWSIEIVPG